MRFDPAKLVRLKRPVYYTGRMLTADDLRAEQEYQREKQWLHNRMLHGYGIVAGLEVGLQEDENGNTQLIVSPGYALDGWGREIVVIDPLTVYLPGDRHDLIVYLRYIEEGTEDEPDESAASNPKGAGTVESVQVTLEPSTPERAIAAAARDDYAIPIARVRRPHQHWQRERDFRPARAR